MADRVRDLNAPVTTIEEAMARVYPDATAQPCNECPWRRKTIPGWLGPTTAQGWVDCAHGESAIACHLTIPNGGGWGPGTRQCRGAAIFRANVAKMPWNRTIATGPADHETVFSSNAEFLNFHDPPHQPDPTDEGILALLAECDGDTWAVAEALCDAEVARGEYEGCSTELELAFGEYKARATRLKEKSHEQDDKG